MSGVDIAHKQVWVKVNAQIDQGIAELVSAFNKIDGLETIASCEGFPGKGEAYVYFYYGRWESIARLSFGNIAPAINDIEGVEISVKVFNGSDPIGKLSMRAGALPQVTSTLIPILSAV